MSGRAGWMTVLLAGLGWAALSLWLYGMGLTPSGPTPFGAEHHRYQAIFVVPLLLGVTYVSGRVAEWGAGRLGGTVPRGKGAEITGLGLGAGAGMGLVAPELFALSRGGLEAMAGLAPWSGLAALLLLVWVQAIMAFNLGKLPAVKALALAAGLTVVQGALLAPLLR